VSTVRKTALYPAAFARLSNLTVWERSSKRYNCKTSGFEPFSAAASSSVVVANDDRPIMIPAFLQALAVAISPSGRARHCMAVGATLNGTEFRWPKIMLPVSMDEISRRTRGRILYLAYADMFSRSVDPESAPSS